MYLIPKRIKVKREIFKNFGIIEILIVALALLIGFLLQNLTSIFELKIFLFFVCPLICFILLLPLPNGSNIFLIVKKFLIFQKRQKKYKFKN